MQKTRKKRKLRKGRLFFLLLILVVISFVCIKFIDVPIRSIIITGNDILTDEEIIKSAGLEDYPSYFGVLSIVIKNNVKKNKYVLDAKVSKGLLSVKIKVTEKKVLYIESSTNQKVTAYNKIKDNKVICVPYLMGDVPKEKEKRFLKAMDKIDKDILCQMSQIKYDPNEIDKDRYFVYMNDGNSVYLTVNKFDKLNKYNTILENIGKQSGVLYLDYGDYFKAY